MLSLLFVIVQQNYYCFLLTSWCLIGHHGNNQFVGFGEDLLGPALDVGGGDGLNALLKVVAVGVVHNEATVVGEPGAVVLQVVTMGFYEVFLHFVQIVGQRTIVGYLGNLFFQNWVEMVEDFGVGVERNAEDLLAARFAGYVARDAHTIGASFVLANALEVAHVEDATEG